MAEIVESTDLESLDSLRLPWTALAGRDAGDGVASSFDRFRALWACAHSSRRLKVLSIIARGKPIGILPLALREQRWGWRSLRVVEFADQQDISGERMLGRDKAASYLMAMRHLVAHRKQWDRIELGPFATVAEWARCQTAMQLTGIYRPMAGEGRDRLHGKS